MAYWRMQSHPNESEGAIRHTVESLSAGYIGLDFATDVPDLLTIPQTELPDNSRNYWSFGREMEVGDWVLLFTHHFPLHLRESQARTTIFVPLHRKLVFGSGISER